MESAPTLHSLLRRDRAIVLGALSLATALAWAYTVHLATAMQGMDAGTAMAMATPHSAPWGVADIGATFVMWSVMMVAMMLPSAAPMILLFASVARRRRERADPTAPVGTFVLGYLLVWVGFSLIATIAQWGLHQATLLTAGVVSAVPAIGGTLLIAAGIYQWTPLKRACLVRCRSPLGFITTEWREGVRGALTMGLRHGVHCLGCCWLLMALLFVAGVMNVVWVWAIAAFVLIEKVVPAGRKIGLVAGPVLAAWGVWLLAGAAGVG